MPGLLQLLNRPVVAILAVGLLAGGLRMWNLASPADRIFDEVYYPKAGCILVGGTDDQCDVDSSEERYWREHDWDVGSWTHPPLGKWMIGLGEKAFGYDAFGWRIASALAGTLMVMAVALLAFLLFGSVLWASVAGLLMSVEGLSFVLSRTGLLDSFVGMWVTFGLLFLVLDRRWIDRRTDPAPEAPEDRAELAPPIDPETDEPATGPDDPPPPRRVPSPIWRPWRFATGLAMGAAIATKWSGALALAAAGLLTLMWETVRRRRSGDELLPAFGWTIARESIGIVLAFLIVPAAVYVLVYLPWFHHFGWSVEEWRVLHVRMWDYHRTLEWFRPGADGGAATPSHPWLSHAWTWLPLRRPVLFFARYPDDSVRWITTIGNPAIFWGAFWTLPYTAYAWWRRRDWRAGFIVVAFAVQFFPWFPVSRPQFLFYMMPMVPLLVLAAVLTARDFSDMRIEQRDPRTGEVAERSRLHPYRPFVWGYVAAAVALFVFFYPVLTGTQISRTAWQLRVWMPSWS